MLDRCIDYLTMRGVRYSHSVHAPKPTARGIAEAERMPAHNLAKTVVYAGDTGYGMAVVPADRFVDLDKVLRLLGLSEIRLAREGELAELFPDCEVGAMPPFGNLFDMPVLVDSEIAGQPYLAVNAGTHRDVIRLSFADFRRLINPLIASFSMKEEPHPVGAGVHHEFAKRTVV
jgi:Ala-tRNA(Pro) deacylase